MLHNQVQFILIIKLILSFSSFSIFFFFLTCIFVCVLPGAGEPDEDELYESAVVESNCVYRLVEDKLIPYEEACASIPTVSLLNSKEV